MGVDGALDYIRWKGGILMAARYTEKKEKMMGVVGLKTILYEEKG